MFQYDVLELEKKKRFQITKIFTSKSKNAYFKCKVKAAEEILM